MTTITLDFKADLIVGRAPVHSTEETSEFINKIKTYEQNLFADQYGKITTDGRLFN